MYLIVRTRWLAIDLRKLRWVKIAAVLRGLAASSKPKRYDWFLSGTKYKILMFASNYGAAAFPCSADTFELMCYLFSNIACLPSSFYTLSDRSYASSDWLPSLRLYYSRFAEDNLLNWLSEVAKLLSWFQDLEDGIYSTLFNLPANLPRFILSRIDLSCLWYWDSWEANAFLLFKTKNEKYFNFLSFYFSLKSHFCRVWPVFSISFTRITDSIYPLRKEKSLK